MNLLELINPHCFSDVRVVDVLNQNIIALLLYVLLSSNHLIFVLKGVKAELGELLREIVRRNRDHSKERSLLCGRLRWQLKLTCNELVALLLQMLIEDDLVHSLCKFKINLT